MVRRVRHDRRSFLKIAGLGLLGAVLKIMADPWEAPAATASDLARRRPGSLPTGQYDHAAQKTTGQTVPWPGTTSGGGEDSCCGSTTFWDGESS
jgi:hypothetical protein